MEFVTESESGTSRFIPLEAVKRHLVGAILSRKCGKPPFRAAVLDTCACIYGFLGDQAQGAVTIPPFIVEQKRPPFLTCSAVSIFVGLLCWIIP